MYAKKKRQKHWYDQNIRTKEFTKGDLVLVYTLKKQKRKHKMHGLGPNVINEITTGGAVRLKTLQGEPMPSFINGSCLKRYHEPLTPEMLASMHAAKIRKEAELQLKLQAQKEAKERATKVKAQRRAKVLAISIVSKEEEEYIPPIQLTVGINTAQATCKAILDMGSDVNIMSQAIYTHLVRTPLQPTTTTFASFSNYETQCKGMVTVNLHVHGCQEQCKFYVAKFKESKTKLILGGTWLHRHRFNYDWEVSTIMLTYGTERYYIHEHKPIPRFTPDPPRPVHKAPHPRYRWVPKQQPKIQSPVIVQTRPRSNQ